MGVNVDEVGQYERRRNERASERARERQREERKSLEKEENPNLPEAFLGVVGACPVEPTDGRPESLAHLRPDACREVRAVGAALIGLGCPIEVEQERKVQGLLRAEEPPDPLGDVPLALLMGPLHHDDRGLPLQEAEHHAGGAGVRRVVHAVRQERVLGAVVKRRLARHHGPGPALLPPERAVGIHELGLDRVAQGQPLEELVLGVGQGRVELDVAHHRRRV